MDSDRVILVSRVSRASAFNPTYMLYGFIYHNVGAPLPPHGIFLLFLSVYIHDTDFISQTEQRGAAVPQLFLQLIALRKTMWYKAFFFLQTISSRIEGDSSKDAPKWISYSQSRIWTFNDRALRKHNGPQALEVAAIILCLEYGTVGLRDIVPGRRRPVNSAGNVVLDKVSVTHRS